MNSTSSMLIIFVAAATAATGCAHNGGGIGAPEARGSIQLTGEARLLVSGPASYVHATADDLQHVSLFISPSINGTDSDCISALATGTVAQIHSSQHLSVPSGRVLCALHNAPSSGSKPIDLLWHAHLDTTDRQLAAR